MEEVVDSSTSWLKILKLKKTTLCFIQEKLLLTNLEISILPSSQFHVNSTFSGEMLICWFTNSEWLEGTKIMVSMLQFIVRFGSIKNVVN